MIQPIILAAGKGTRMRSPLPKVLYEVNGKPMLESLLETFEDVDGYLKPVVVVGYEAEKIRERFGKSLTYAMQEVQSGTGSAVAAALPALDPAADAVLVVYGDQPFLREETLEAMQNIFAIENPDLAVGVVTVPNFDGKFVPFNAFGRIVQDNGSVSRVVEYKNATDAQKDIRELNAGLCLVRASWLVEGLALITPNELTGELYLTHLVSISAQAQKKICTINLEPQEALGINSPEDALQAPLFV